MAEYIDRSKIKYHTERCESWFGCQQEWHDTLVAHKESIDAIPAADVVEVRHGRWIEDACGAIWCSQCSHAEESCEQKMYHYRYCPNCGAKMDGGADDGNS